MKKTTTVIEGTGIASYNKLFITRSKPRHKEACTEIFLIIYASPLNSNICPNNRYICFQVSKSCIKKYKSTQRNKQGAFLSSFPHVFGLTQKQQVAASSNVQRRGQRRGVKIHWKRWGSRGTKRADTISSWSGWMSKCNAADALLRHIHLSCSREPSVVRESMRKSCRPTSPVHWEREENMKLFHQVLESNLCWGGKIFTNKSEVNKSFISLGTY